MSKKCRRCGRPSGEKSACPECAAWNAMRMRKADAAKLKAKRCRQPGCGEPALSQRTRCAKHLEQARDRAKARREDRGPLTG